MKQLLKSRPILKTDINFVIVSHIYLTADSHKTYLDISGHFWGE